MKKVDLVAGLKKTDRKLGKFEEGNYKEQFMETHKMGSKRGLLDSFKKYCSKLVICKIFKRC